MRKLVVDYGQASIAINNVNSSLEYLNEELRQIKNAISEIEALNVRYSKINTILDELYEQKKKAEDAYNEMEKFSGDFSKFINNVKTTDKELAKKFTSDVKTYCKKNNIEITSAIDELLDNIQKGLDIAGWLPIIGEPADALNFLISLCRGNYLEAAICLLAILPLGDMLKSLKYADSAKGILKYGDECLSKVNSVAKITAEKLSKQITKVIKSGKFDNIISVIDCGKDSIVKLKDGTITLVNDILPHNKLELCLETGSFSKLDDVVSKARVNFIETVENTSKSLSKKVSDKFKRFYDEDSVIEWGQKFEDWSFDLLDEEADAITCYTENKYYRNINSVLRGLEKEFHVGNAEIVENISKALNKCELPEDIIVHRITSQTILGDIKSLPLEDMVDNIIKEKAFMSTSLLEKSTFTGNLKLIIEASKGSTAAYIADLSRCFTEYEVLFDKGQEMMIKSATQLDNGQLELVVRILNK
ncbi:MAG: ADP-ribosyltransferase [Clostridium sp.]|uniref:ADP-ribosyltransferase n=1 Tax=Clostridium sp. TaxID=1506 RepID=UPI0039951A5D